MTGKTLQEHWANTWARLALQAPAGLCEQLLACYAETHRHYHSQQHLSECLALFSELQVACAHPDEVALALWFHDAIYDTQAHDNEARSAAWAARTLTEAGADAAVTARVEALILATRHAHMPQDQDEAVLVDIDLAILGADPQRYREYTQQVRAEYAHVPPEAFRQGRRQVLAAFLQRPAIYSLPAMAAREAQARRNMEQELAGLI